MKRIISLSFPTAAIAAILGFGSPRLQAQAYTYNFTGVFSGVTPSGTGPWVDATFQNTTGGVLLTINNAALSSGEFVSDLYFNLNPAAGNVNNLTFTLENSSAGVSAPLVDTGNDSFKADGDGKYDILLQFSSGKARQFGAGDSMTFLISGIAGLTAADFEQESAPSGGASPYYAAAEIQGCPAGNGVCWSDPCDGPVPLPVPEPAPLAVMAVSFAALLGRRFWKRQSIA